MFLPCFLGLITCRRPWAEPGPLTAADIFSVLLSCCASSQMSCCPRTFWTIRTAVSTAPTEDRSSGRLTPAPTSLRVRVPPLNPDLPSWLSSGISHTLFCCVCDEDQQLTVLFLLLPTSAETRVCFRYYHGLTGALRATTPSVTIKTGCAAVSLAIFTFSSSLRSGLALQQPGVFDPPQL